MSNLLPANNGKVSPLSIPTNEPICLNQEEESPQRQGPLKIFSLLEDTFRDKLKPINWNIPEVKEDYSLDIKRLISEFVYSQRAVFDDSAAWSLRHMKDRAESKRSRNANDVHTPVQSIDGTVINIDVANNSIHDTRIRNEQINFTPEHDIIAEQGRQNHDIQSSVNPVSEFLQYLYGNVPRNSTHDLPKNNKDTIYNISTSDTNQIDSYLNKNSTLSKENVREYIDVPSTSCGIRLLRICDEVDTIGTHSAQINNTSNIIGWRKRLKRDSVLDGDTNIVEKIATKIDKTRNISKETIDESFLVSAVVSDTEKEEEKENKFSKCPKSNARVHYEEKCNRKESQSKKNQNDKQVSNTILKLNETQEQVKNTKKHIKAPRIGEKKNFRFRISDAVDVRVSINGRYRWLPGRVLRVHSNGIYDVQINNGDVKKGIIELEIRRKGEGSSPRVRMRQPYINVSTGRDLTQRIMNASKGPEISSYTIHRKIKSPKQPKLSTRSNVVKQIAMPKLDNDQTKLPWEVASTVQLPTSDFLFFEDINAADLVNEMAIDYGPNGFQHEDEYYIDDSTTDLEIRLAQNAAKSDSRIINAKQQMAQLKVSLEQLEQLASEVSAGFDESMKIGLEQLEKHDAGIEEYGEILKSLRLMNRTTPTAIQELKSRKESANITQNRVSLSEIDPNAARELLGAKSLLAELENELGVSKSTMLPPLQPVYSRRGMRAYPSYVNNSVNVPHSNNYSLPVESSLKKKLMGTTSRHFDKKGRPVQSFHARKRNSENVSKSYIRK